MVQQGGVLSYPIPAWQNTVPEPEFYLPSRFVIENIDLGQTTTVTTTEDHNYVIGQECRLLIPASFGSYQLNEIKGNVLSIPQSDQVVLSIDSSRNVDAYIASSVVYPSVAQIVAVGDYNSGQQNTQGRINQLTYIPGSFRNISPNRE
jgi:hypothetical protein